jgi:ABC-type antimicrobial peptide transport system permease subunit
MREVVLLLAVGIAVALPLVFLLNRFVRSELYGVQSNDSVSIAFSVVLLSCVALLAGYIPALRASAYDPMQVLRYE